MSDSGPRSPTEEALWDAVYDLQHELGKLQQEFEAYKNAQAQAAIFTANMNIDRFGHPVTRPTSNTANPQSKPCGWCGDSFGPNPKWPQNFKNAKFCSAKCLSAWKQRPRIYDPQTFWARVDRSAGP